MASKAFSAGARVCRAGRFAVPSGYTAIAFRIGLRVEGSGTASFAVIGANHNCIGLDSAAAPAQAAVRRAITRHATSG